MLNLEVVVLYVPPKSRRRKTKPMMIVRSIFVPKREEYKQIKR